MFPPFPNKIISTFNNSYYSYSCIGVMSWTMLTEKGEQCYFLTPCKEYLLDQVAVAVNGVTSNSSVPTCKKCCLTETLVLVQNHKYPEKSLSLLHGVEDRLRLPRTLLNTAGENQVVFRGAANWLVSAPTLSMYSLLIRMGAMHEVGETLETLLDRKTADKKFYDTDTTILNLGGANGLLKLVSEGFGMFGTDLSKNWHGDNNSRVHMWGIASFGARNTDMVKQMPDWFS